VQEKHLNMFRRLVFGAVRRLVEMKQLLERSVERSQGSRLYICTARRSYRKPRVDSLAERYSVAARAKTEKRRKRKDLALED
jgi:hypothetical protein